MIFKIVWDPKALSELNGFEPLVAKRIAIKVGELGDGPFSRDIKKLKGSSDFRLRVGDYRVIFSINGDTLEVLKVGHRKNIYKR